MISELLPVTNSLLLLALSLVILLVGVLIGSIGVGGVLLVPALAYLADIDVHTAIAAAMLSYLFSGLVGGILYAARGSIRWSSGLQLCLGAMPGAYLGALAVSLMPADTVKMVIALFVIFASTRSLARPGSTGSAVQGGTLGWLLTIGLIVGFCSSITGTGGPLVLVPLLVWLNWPVLAAVGLSQLIQLPISLFATLGNLRYGHVDFTLGIGIALVMVIGVAIGSKLAHSLPSAQLRKIVGLVLALVGLWMFWQSASLLLQTRAWFGN